MAASRLEERLLPVSDSPDVEGDVSEDKERGIVILPEDTRDCEVDVMELGVNTDMVDSADADVSVPELDA